MPLNSYKQSNYRGRTNTCPLETYNFYTAYINMNKDSGYTGLLLECTIFSETFMYIVTALNEH